MVCHGSGWGAGGYGGWMGNGDGDGVEPLS